jgi:hypothetical protein
MMYTSVVWPLEDLLSCSLAVFALRLGSGPGLSFLWQHRVSGRALLPGAAMFEAAHAAGSSLLGLSSEHHDVQSVSLPVSVCLQVGDMYCLARCPCLLDSTGNRQQQVIRPVYDCTGDEGIGDLVLCSLAIEAPLLLPPPRPGPASDTALHVVLDLQDGGVRLQSSAKGRRCEGYLLTGCAAGVFPQQEHAVTRLKQEVCLFRSATQTRPWLYCTTYQNRPLVRGPA